MKGSPSLIRSACRSLAIVAIGVVGILWLGIDPAMILNLAANSTLALK